MFRQDLIQRAIEQLTQALARALKLSRDDQPSQALECLREAKGALPIVPGMVEDMDPATLVKTLGPASAQVLARVLAAEAELLERLGRSLLAERPRQQSRELLELLERASPNPARS